MTDVFLGIGEPGNPQASLDDDPTFDEPAAPGAEPVGGELSVDTVRGVLEVIGLTVHGMIGEEDAGEDHWRFTPDELDLLAPAVLRIAMRRPKLRQAIEHGDELTVALLLAGYFGRNVEATRVARKEHDADLDRQTPGTSPFARLLGGGSETGSGDHGGHGGQGPGRRADDGAADGAGQGR